MWVGQSIGKGVYLNSKSGICVILGCSGEFYLLLQQQRDLYYFFQKGKWKNEIKYNIASLHW